MLWIVFELEPNYSVFCFLLLKMVSIQFYPIRTGYHLMNFIIFNWEVQLFENLNECLLYYQNLFLLTQTKICYSILKIVIFLLLILTLSYLLFFCHFLLNNQIIGQTHYSNFKLIFFMLFIFIFFT